MRVGRPDIQQEVVVLVMRGAMEAGARVQLGMHVARAQAKIGRRMAPVAGKERSAVPHCVAAALREALQIVRRQVIPSSLSTIRSNVPAGQSPGILAWATGTCAKPAMHLRACVAAAVLTLLGKTSSQREDNASVILEF